MPACRTKHPPARAGVSFCRQDAPRCEQVGFTLVEIVVAIVILGIVAATVSARWPSRAIDIDAQAQQLAADIRYAQSLSMTEGARFRINVDAATESYQIVTQAGGAVNHPLTLNPGAITLTDGVTIASTTHAFIVFDGRGIPYTDAVSPGTPLAATASIVLDTPGESRTIQIVPETGRVVVQ